MVIQFSVCGTPLHSTVVLDKWVKHSESSSVLSHLATFQMCLLFQMTGTNGLIFGLHEINGDIQSLDSISCCLLLLIPPKCFV